MKQKCVCIQRLTATRGRCGTKANNVLFKTRSVGKIVTQQAPCVPVATFGNNTKAFLSFSFVYCIINETTTTFPERCFASGHLLPLSPRPHKQLTTTAVLTIHYANHARLTFHILPNSASTIIILNSA